MKMCRPRHRLPLLAPALGLALSLLASGSVRAEKPAAPAAGSKAQTVTVGCYLQNVPEIEVKSNSFHAELYLWFVWSGSIDPTLTFQLTNAIGMADLSKTPVYTDAAGAAKPEELPDGRFYQVFHVQGRFGHPFSLAKFPFDDHEIVISVEDAKHPIGDLVHEVDTKGSATRPDLVIPGWRLNRMRAETRSSTFATTFGDPRATSAQETYSHVDFVVHIDRPVAGLLSKTVIPLAIIILITFGAFFVQPEDIDARLCLTITALISAVALQFTASTELPPTGYLILLDKIYILSYAAILAVTFFSIAANRKSRQGKDEDAHRLDRIGLWVCAGGYFGLLILMLAVH
jgi:hypothetical protein